MFCRNCGAEVKEKADYCVSCGARPLKGNKFCSACGAETRPDAEICVKCGARLRTVEEGKDWLVALLLSIFLGALGVDRFYLGHIGTGILKLLLTLLTGIGGLIWWLIDVILIATNKLTDSKGRALVRNL